MFKSDYISEILIDNYPSGFSVKSNICLEGKNTHCNSKILLNKFFPRYNSRVIDLLIEKGCL